MIKTTLFAFLLAFALCGNAAQPTAESIETLLTVTKAESMIDVMMGSVEQAMRQGMARSVAGKPVTAEQQRVLDAVPTQFVAVMKEAMSWSNLKPMYVQIYQESFTQEEIDGLIAFYRSPAGAAFVDKMPLVMQKSMTLMQARMQPMMARMKSVMDKALADAKISK